MDTKDGFTRVEAFWSGPGNSHGHRVESQGPKLCCFVPDTRAITEYCTPTLFWAATFITSPLLLLLPRPPRSANNLAWTERGAEWTKNSSPPALIGSTHFKGVINDFIKCTSVQIIHWYEQARGAGRWMGGYWNTYANGIHHERTLHYRLYNGLVSDPTLRRVAVMCQMSGSAVGFLGIFLKVFFLFQKVKLHSHLPFLIRPLSLWNVTWERKRGRTEEKSSPLQLFCPKNVPPSIWTTDPFIRLSRGRQANISVYHNAQMHRRTCTSEGEGLNCNSEDREIVWKAAGVMMKTLWKETYYAFSFFSFPSVFYIQRFLCS